MSTTTPPTDPIIAYIREYPFEVTDLVLRNFEDMHIRKVERARLIESGEYAIDLEYVRSCRAYREECYDTLIVLFLMAVLWFCIYPYTSLCRIIVCGVLVRHFIWCVRCMQAWYALRGQGLDAWAYDYDARLHPVSIREQATKLRLCGWWYYC